MPKPKKAETWRYKIGDIAIPQEVIMRIRDLIENDWKLRSRFLTKLSIPNKT